MIRSGGPVPAPELGLDPVETAGERVAVIGQDGPQAARRLYTSEASAGLTRSTTIAWEPG